MDSNFLTIINWIFDRLLQVWTVIKNNWILAIGVLIMVLEWVISLINGSRQQ